jgi:ribosomal protein S27E
VKRKLRIVIDCGDTFCAGCEHVEILFYDSTIVRCRTFGAPLIVAGDGKPKRHAKCLEAEGMR